MDEAAFWSLVEEAGREAEGGQRKGLFGRQRAGGRDLERQAELIRERLAELDPEEILEFNRIWDELHDRAYSWDLWGAAYVINGGCSDDCFDYFRAYLIGLGREAYELGMRDPDALVDFADAEGDWEALMSPAWEAYERQTGNEIPLTVRDRASEPSGEAWEEDQTELERRYPRLSAKFG